MGSFAEHRTTSESPRLLLFHDDTSAMPRAKDLNFLTEIIFDPLHRHHTNLRLSRRAVYWARRISASRDSWCLLDRETRGRADDFL
jgi:hypothetical protein